MDADIRRQLPSVNELLLKMQDEVLVEGHERVVDILRAELGAARVEMLAGKAVPATDRIVQMARESLHPLDGMGSTTVINATGVIIHTNLGRAVLSRAAQLAINTVARGYSPLEFSLGNGLRSTRGTSVENLLCQ